jgi:hypothetical protein
MKALKISVVFFLLFTSCIINDYAGQYDEEFTQEIFIEEYDLWYVDYHATVGSDQIPFMKLAFTLSFNGGVMYANNNISGLGFQGDGYGVRVGGYLLNNGRFVINHELDGVNDFEIKQISDNEIIMYHKATDTSYFLIGYNIGVFDYEKLFYENIEYLLQDFEIWSKYYTGKEGRINNFDYENFLKFTSEKNNTFYSSKSIIGTDIDFVFWNSDGGYQIQDVIGFDYLKVLTLSYDSVNFEVFELTVVNDTIIELFHVSSQTTYRFEGDYFIQYLKDGKYKNRIDRKRTKIKREKVNKISY